MKQYLNTLYITTPESYLFKDGECVAIKQEGQVKGKIPVHTLGSLVLFGQVSCSPFLLGHCAENGTGRPTILKPARDWRGRFVSEKFSIAVPY